TGYLDSRETVWCGVPLFEMYDIIYCFFFQAEDGIRDRNVTGVQTCALPISSTSSRPPSTRRSPPETAPPSARRPPRRADGLRRGPPRRTPDPGPPPEGHPMLVRSLADIADTDADIKSDTWRSKRIILAKEGVGFSVHETTLYEGTESYFWYANHIEAVFITHGEGEIEDLATGEVHQLAPGTLYLLNDHDKHKVRVRKEIRCVCVFNPP